LTLEYGMIAFILGLAGFVLFFVYDINSYTRRSRALRPCFALGAALIAVFAGMELLSARKAGAFSGVGDMLLLLLGLASLALLIYCLFFALPFSETYLNAPENRHVYDSGAYALCRHPGVLCFFAVFLFWGLAALPSAFLAKGMALSAINAAYAWFQDRVTFPKTFSDYPEYRDRVPFLIPTKNSLRSAFRMRSRAGGKRKKK